MRSHRRLSLAAWSVFLAMLPGPAPAKEPAVVCGTERNGWQEAVAVHRRLAAKRSSLGRQAAVAAGPAAPIGRDAGSIAVMYGSGGIISPRNLFNLGSKGISFRPSGSGYVFTTADAVYDEAAAQNGVNIDGLNDDDTRRVSIPFAFPFFGAKYNEIWVNSDGNISFEEGDSASVSKSIGLLTGGPPRIAPLLIDLDPSFSLKGVRVRAEPAGVTVTWLEIPEFRSSGSGPPQTVQLRLYPDGRIEFAYPRITALQGVVGIAPGRSKGPTDAVSFLEGSSREFPGAIAERFTTSESLDSVLLAQRFYQTHDDSYDYLAVYNNIGMPAQPFAVALEFTLRSRFRAGFGDTEVDVGAQYGSPSRLQAFLNMGPLSQYPADPFEPVPARGSTGDTPLSILAHEVGHLFLALASIRDESNPSARPMLGQALAHWSFNFNSEASFLEGNRIEDDGENVNPRFRSSATVEQYSPLDQYLMGLRPPVEVPPTFLVRNSGRLADEQPRRGATFNGTRQNITVDEVIAAEGRRSPDHTVAQRNFRIAIILLTREGAEPSAAEIQKIERLRAEFESYFATATHGRARADTTLKPSVHLSVWPAAGVVAGASITATVRLNRPAEAPLTVLLKTRKGVAEVPASVTVPAGQQQASFTLLGLTEGVEEITAEPSDSAYRADHARVQVSPDPGGLTLTVAGGDRQFAEPGVSLAREVELRVSDINLIPYPGIAVQASVSAPGVVEPPVAITGADGIARFRWTPGDGVNELTATIEGTDISTSASAVRRLLARTN